MYLSHFGLDREPFHITPDPDFLYLSPSHQEAAASIIYGVRQRKGFIKVTGEPGTGKTTILRSYISEIKGERIHPLYLFVPGMKFKDVLRSIIKGMKIETAAASTTDMLTAIHWGLIELYKKGHVLVLIIDEAQQMSIQTLEQLRLLANLETTKEKLMQIVLCGQPEFDEMLHTPELRQLRQRIAVRAVINPLTRMESIAYIRHRLQAAGCPRASLFSPAAERTIAAYAKGCPRTINICCDNALVAGFAKQVDTVHSPLVRRVIHDLERDSRKSRISKRELAGAAAIAALLLIFAGGVWVGRGLSAAPVAASPAAPVMSVSLTEPAFSVPAPETNPAPVVKVEDVEPVPGGVRAEAGGDAAALSELPVAVWAAQPGETIEGILRHVHGEVSPDLLATTLAMNPSLAAGEALAEDQKIKIPESAVVAAVSEVLAVGEES